MAGDVPAIRRGLVNSVYDSETQDGYPGQMQCHSVLRLRGWVVTQDVLLSPASPVGAATVPSNLSNSGLSGDEARSRLERFGPNYMPDTSAHLIRSALSKFWAPVPWMLEAVIIVELSLHEYVEASVIAVLLVFNAALSFFQESHAQATLTALKSRLALTASVHGDGVWSNVPSSDLVTGDIVKLSLGGVVAADVRLLEGSALLDQSMLTGEFRCPSKPVRACRPMPERW